MPVIAHISDIHIRSLKRHDEYISVFKKLSIDCRKNNVDYIFLGGDLFHTKLTGISPEYIELLTWWLNDLSSIAPVHIILGNHDGNENNLNRQDAVTPIISAMNNSRVFLYKKSGVYEFHPGWNWCVFGIFDKENWINVKPEEDKINIACYHGSVSGAKTETGYELEGEVNVSFFKDYDYAFLGDIHMLQFLGTKEIEVIISEEELKNYSDYEIIEEVSI
jgi:DNA repair exonuclease SbcCD nuclease subunit